MVPRCDQYPTGKCDTKKDEGGRTGESTEPALGFGEANTAFWICQLSSDFGTSKASN